VHEISDWVTVMAQGQLIAEGTATQISGTQSVIDAYLGAHHDVDLGAMDDETATEALHEFEAEEEAGT
jgi:neutral amino acid transport system ATP-binding protein